MTEPADQIRIRWEGPDSSGTLTGHVGTLAVWLFRIWRDGGKGWRLDCILPGWDGEASYSHAPEKLQGRAEAWLGEFAASLGAVFPEPAEGKPWHDGWTQDGRDGDGNLLLCYEPTGALYRVLPEEEC